MIYFINCSLVTLVYNFKIKSYNKICINNPIEKYNNRLLALIQLQSNYN